MNKWIQILKDLWQRRSEWAEKLKDLWKLRNFKIAAGGLVLLIVVVAVFSGSDPEKEVADDAYRCRVQRGDLVISILQSGELTAK